VFLIAVLFNQYFDNFLSVASVLIAVVVGYLMAAPLGLLDLSGVADAGWVAVPMPSSSASSSTRARSSSPRSRTSSPPWRRSATWKERPERSADATSEEMRGGLLADGVMSMIAGVFNAFPNTSFSQNVGLIRFTGVASKFVVAICGASSSCSA